MSATVISGKSGVVKISSSSVGAITVWTLRKEAVVDRWASSDSGGYKQAVSGVKSASGTLKGKFNNAAAFPALEGASVTLVLYTDGTINYSVPAIIRDFDVEVDIDDGKAISFTASFESNGTYVEPF